MSLQQLSDQELYRLIDQGREGAFSALLAKHYDSLFAFAFKYCRHREDAEDIVQETLLKIARSFGQFDRKHLFTTWAYRIVINTAKDLFKKQRQDRLMGAAYALEIDDSGDCEAVPPGDGLWKLLDRLPKKLYDAVVLVYGQDLSHAEAAVALGCAETTVSWRLYQARRQLSRQAVKAGLLLLVLLGGSLWMR